MSHICAEQTVELPGWVEGEPFIAKLRRPSILSMAADGTIPNELLSAAQKLFCEGYDAALPLDQLGRLLRSVAAAALAEPTLGELESQGVTLTDMQLAAIYSFTQSGVRALEPFRDRAGADNSAGAEPAVFGKTEQSA